MSIFHSMKILTEERLNLYICSRENVYFFFHESKMRFVGFAEIRSRDGEQSKLARHGITSYDQDDNNNRGDDVRSRDNRRCQCFVVIEGVVVSATHGIAGEQRFASRRYGRIRRSAGK